MRARPRLGSPPSLVSNELVHVADTPNRRSPCTITTRTDMTTPSPRPNPQPSPRRPDWGKVAALAAVAAAVIAAIALIPALVPLVDGQPPSPRQDPPTASRIAITTPVEGAPVDGSFTVQGVAMGLGEDDIWLFVIGGNADVPGDVYYRTTDTPLVIVNEHWQTQIGPLGEPGDPAGQAYTLELVRANPACSLTLANLKPNANGETFLQAPLPSGCATVLPERHVKKGA